MPQIVTPPIRKIYKTLIRQIVEDLHKPVTIFLPPEAEDCPNCLWSSVHQKSSGVYDTSFTVPVVVFGNTITPTPFDRSRCPVCFGEGQLTQEVRRSIKALVKWDPKSEIKEEPIGREGRPTVRIKALRSNFNNIVNAVYFEVDGVRCELIEPPTIRGLGTQEELVIAYLLAVEEGYDVKR